MPVSLKDLNKQWVKVDAKKAKTAAYPVTKFVTKFTTQFREYDRARFVDGVSGDNAKSDTARYVKAFDDYTKEVATLARGTSLGDKEKAFLTELQRTLAAELDFWRKDPIANQVPIELSENLRKHWSERKKAAEDAYSKMHPAGPAFPCKFDEGFGPALDKFEKAKTRKERDAMGTRLTQVTRSYFLQIKTKKAELGEIPYDLLMKQLNRIDEVVQKAMK